MGVHRSDIRLVVRVRAVCLVRMPVLAASTAARVHWTIPESLVALYQEWGRAGRDGRSATCALFYSYHDKGRVESMLRRGGGSAHVHARVEKLLDLVAMCEDVRVCRRVHLLRALGQKLATRSPQQREQQTPQQQQEEQQPQQPQPLPQSLLRSPPCADTTCGARRAHAVADSDAARPSARSAERKGAWCGRCDVCCGDLGEIVETDVSEAAACAVRVVSRLNGMLTLKQLEKVLWGSKEKWLGQDGYSELSEYGAAAAMGRATIARVLRLLVARRMLREVCTPCSHGGFRSRVFLGVRAALLFVESVETGGAERSHQGADDAERRLADERRDLAWQVGAGSSTHGPCSRDPPYASVLPRSGAGWSHADEAEGCGSLLHARVPAHASWTVDDMPRARALLLFHAVPHGVDGAAAAETPLCGGGAGAAAAVSRGAGVARGGVEAKRADVDGGDGIDGGGGGRRLKSPRTRCEECLPQCERDRHAFFAGSQVRMMRAVGNTFRFRVGWNWAQLEPRRSSLCLRSYGALSVTMPSVFP
eukprot:5072745-Pleurochrysis_carterae.AAC.2